MRSIEISGKFKREMRHLMSGIYRNVVKPKSELWEVIDALAEGLQLPEAYRDHPLHGNFEGSRECHIRPDLLLVYTLEGDELLRLERLGSHSEIFGM